MKPDNRTDLIRYNAPWVRTDDEIREILERIDSIGKNRTVGEKPEASELPRGLSREQGTRRCSYVCRKSLEWIISHEVPDLEADMDRVPDCTVGSSSASEPAPDPESELIEELIRTLRRNNVRQLMELGLTAEMLEFVLGGKPKLSRIRITRAGTIILTDYDREIRLDDKSTALYLLYLRHPEGIAIKNLQDYAGELEDLYMSVSCRDSKQAMRDTVANLLNPYGNEANVCISRIKKAFTEAFCDALAKTYYIDGKRGEARSIALDRSLVEWETIR